MFLCSDLSANTTGTQVVVDGGRSGAGGVVVRR
jgi:enoyl-[acyl-carrier-protein] reductase (NADH)